MSVTMENLMRLKPDCDSIKDRKTGLDATISLASLEITSQMFKESYYRSSKDEILIVMSELVLLNKYKAIRSRYETDFARSVSFS